MENRQHTTEELPKVRYIGEERKRKEFLESHSIPINKIMGYEIFDYQGANKGVLIVLAPMKDLEFAEIETLVRSGLESLALVVKKELSVKIISIASWIVKEHPEIFLTEEAGFKMDNSLGAKVESARLVQRYIYGFQEGVGKRAVISRENFLRIYLK